MAADRPSRAEIGNTCPLGFHGNAAPHVWIETTEPGDSKRTFGCDTCPARAAEDGDSNAQ